MLLEDFVKLLKFSASNMGNKTPLYLQLSQSISAGVLTGTIASGVRLPASRYLAKALSISRATVVNAYEQLQAEGIVESKQGDGTYIRNNIQIARPRKINYKNSKRLFSSRAKPLIKHSETLKTKNHPLLLPGAADLTRFPDRYWKQLYNRYAHKHIGMSVSHEHIGGYLPLREAIAAHINIVRDIDCDADQVFIMNGLQHSTNFIFNMLCDPADEVLIEDPGYPAVMSSALITGLTIKPLPLDKHGAMVPKTANSKTKAIYLTPSHQFPMGMKMPMSRRVEMIEFAQANNLWIIEDDYDNEFPQQLKPLPAMKGLDAYDRIIYSGTFSKVLAGYIKISYLIVPNQLKHALRSAAMHLSFETPLMLQAVIADYIKQGYFHRHLRIMRSIYATKQKFATELIDKEFSGIGIRHGGESGLHVVIELTSDIDDKEVCEIASEHAMGCRPLSEVCLAEKKRGIIIGLGYGETRQLETGIKQLAKITRELITSMTALPRR